MTARTARRRRDAGQAFPIYIVAVAGLLFLAFAFFAVGQAAATRNSAQTAADAAALAAGQQYRDQLSAGFIDALRHGAAWQDLIEGRGVDSGAACDHAAWFAGRNDATVSSCTPDSWPTSFAVRVTSRTAVGRSVIPGTEHTHAAADATAVVAPRCTVSDTPGEGTGNGKVGDGNKDANGKGGKDGKGDGKPGGGDSGDAPSPVRLVCDGRAWQLDPAALHGLPEAADLFSVRLAR
ncbi:pilus assembly protein TadG-related protein [Streptomyces pinistramenti]|uniref:pilus assembly protein TadG-related protein n=1 Tax=Streptomyces pinistramenti TaxID=2884812 RepID=UPI001D073289|nr:pilus assembly protein TadG-related protein [Streptomyces pinistramenti]MCB5912340.1 pilus assembly protein TadG-related protein [Streptomyces pinistramenti]